MSTVAAPPAANEFTASELEQFERDGFVVCRNLADDRLCRRMRDVTLDGLARRVEPLELEADLHYPGAPLTPAEPGGATIRRLLQAHSRDYVFTEWLLDPGLAARLRQLLGPEYRCPLAHHNCIMTKQPEFSSETGWHQDIRYWSFVRPDLVTAWLALGRERVENGCLRVIPGTHRMSFDREQLDDQKFFRSDWPANAAIITRSVDVELEPGDVLFFHCRLLHAAGRNVTGETKYSVVFTFHDRDNAAVPGSRSAGSPTLLLG